MEQQNPGPVHGVNDVTKADTAQLLKLLGEFDCNGAANFGKYQAKWAVLRELDARLRDPKRQTTFTNPGLEQLLRELTTLGGGVAVMRSLVLRIKSDRLAAGIFIQADGHMHDLV
jgi:hypothetical protein